jgi:hypothetical protein
MAVKESELFHGAVLTRLLRKEKPVTLRLVETRANESWSTYTLNDSVDLLVSHSKSPRDVSRNGGGTSWSFAFSRNQLRQMNPGVRNRPVYVALVCGRASPSDGKMYTCLLYPEEVADLVDFSGDQQSLTVRKPDRKGELRVLKDRRVRVLVPQSRLDRWEVPGG